MTTRRLGIGTGRHQPRKENCSQPFKGKAKKPSQKSSKIKAGSKQALALFQGTKGQGNVTYIISPQVIRFPTVFNTKILIRGEGKLLIY